MAPVRLDVLQQRLAADMASGEAAPCRYFGFCDLGVSLCIHELLLPVLRMPSTAVAGHGRWRQGECAMT